MGLGITNKNILGAIKKNQPVTIKELLTLLEYTKKEPKVLLEALKELKAKGRVVSAIEDGQTKFRLTK